MQIGGGLTGGLSSPVALLAVTGQPAEAETRAYVLALLDGGFSVVLAHADPAVLAPLREMLDARPALVAVRGGPGEFPLWRDALAATGLPKPGTTGLVLASTRVRGPLAPLAGVLKQFDWTGADLWGVTESWQGRYHLPTFLAGFGPRALACPAWAEFWSTLPAFAGRAAAFQPLEVALTQRLLEHGLIARAVWSYQMLLDRAGMTFAELSAQLRATGSASKPLSDADRATLTHLRRVRTLQANRTPMEPLSFFWRELLDLGAPFVSRELLGRNPHGIVTAALCAERVRALSA